MILPWLRLLRAPNLPSAASNVLAGAAVGSALQGAELNAGKIACACLASVCVYACGLIWNDLADEEFDRVARPERPLPRKEISRRGAWALTLVLLLLAGALAFPLSEHSRWMLGIVAVLAFLYDFALKASPFLGPAALGLCRSLNLVFGMSLAVHHPISDEVAGVLHVAAFHYFLYVAMLSSFARMEDSEVEIRRARIELFALALVVFSFAIRLIAWQGPEFELPRLLASGLPLLALGLFALRRSMVWRNKDADQARETVVWLLAGVLFLDAALASYAWGAWGLILLAPAALGPYLRRTISAS